MDLKEVGSDGVEPGPSGSGQVPEAVCCEHCDISSDSMKGELFRY
jgi:hypothetical protein